MRNLLFLPILLVLFSSCSQKLVPLTDSLRKDYTLNAEVVNIVQLYDSKEIVLTIDSSSGERSIKNGIIYDKKGKNISEVIIFEKTPGICIGVSGSSLLVSFDERENPLTFEIYPDYVESFGKIIKKDNPNYRLQSDYWGPVSGEFNFNGRSMHTPSTNRYAHLLVDLRKVSKLEKESRVARGVKVH